MPTVMAADTMPIITISNHANGGLSVVKIRAQVSNPASKTQMT